ncbi:MAG TPA: DMT family transporter [Actinomycetota bacterium]|nr:DMT family transporter [Actinomycetota bacterium]
MPVLALVGVTAIWGLTFVLVKDAVEAMPPLRFLAIRFLLAGLVLLPFGGRPRLSSVRNSVPTGIALAVGYALQTIGLRYTGATRSGFITGLAVIFTPLVGAVLFGIRSSLRMLVAVLASGLGMFLLIGADLRHANLGDLLTLGCAISFAFHLLLQARAVVKVAPVVLASMQMLIAGGLFLMGSVLTETQAFSFPPKVLVALAVTAVGGSAIAFLVMAWAQRHLSPTQTAVILSAEPVFAGIAGYALLGERLSPVAWVGASLILTAMLAVSTVRERNEI